MVSDAAQGGAFLGVERSATGRRWVGPGIEIARQAERIAQLTGQPPLVSALLAERAVDPADVDAYMSPRLRDLMPDPSCLVDMGPAVERLTDAIAKREPVAVFGDYDVDGGASSALLATWLRRLDVPVRTYIPDRVTEGYGPNVAAMRHLAESHRLIVCVDCGTVAGAPIAAARAAGADVIVVDHHIAGEALPDALVVNPNREDDTSDLGYLCAAGVVFMMLVAANRRLRERGRAEVPDLMAALDLVAVATVADVAPMVGLNRAFVRQGIAVLGQRHRPGLAALCDVAGLRAPPTARDLGFALGPRLNAGGRLASSDLAVRLLSTDDPHEAAALSEQLDGLNAERRGIEAAVRDAAEAQIEQRGVSGALVWAAGEGWHPGVIGIVASRLKDRYGRPAIVIALDGTEGKGSGRSVAGVDLGSTVAGLYQRGLLIAGGGHKMAAGLTVARDRLDAVMSALEDGLARQCPEPGRPEDLHITGLVSPAGATCDLVTEIENAGPFGPANPVPCIGLDAVTPTYARVVGQGHLQVRFGRGSAMVDGIAFGAMDGPLGEMLMAAATSKTPVHVAGTLEIDDWGGRRRAKLRIEDAAACP